MAAAGGVGDAGVIVAALIAGDPLAVTILDATKLLDVNMDQLAGTFALVALSGLQAKPTESSRAERLARCRGGRSERPRRPR